MRPIQVELLPPSSVVYDHSKTARCRDDKFLCHLVGMPAPCGTGWDIVQVVCSFERKGYVAVSFDKGQVAPVIRDFR